MSVSSPLRSDQQTAPATGTDRQTLLFTSIITRIISHVCVQELREHLQSAQASVQQLRRQLGEAESGRQDAELRLQTLQVENDDAHRERETAVRERDRLRKEKDTLSRSVSHTRNMSLLNLHTKLNTLSLCQCEGWCG